MGDLRTDLRSDVHAPWLPSGLYTVTLQTWRFPDKRSYSDVCVYLDDSCNRTDKVHDDIKIGTLISNLLPIAVILEVIWVIFFIIWYLIGLQIGPGVGSALPVGIL